MESEDPRLYTYEEWHALTEEQREAVIEDRRRAVEWAKREHEARTALLDSLTVERFGTRAPW